MAEFKRTYTTGRMMVGVAGFVGWIVTGIGLLTVASGAVSVLAIGSVTGLEAVTALSGLATGAAVALIGSSAIAGAQVMRAVFDIADISRASLAAGQGSVGRPSAAPLGAGLAGSREEGAVRSAPFVAADKPEREARRDPVIKVRAIR
ncbi:hypothetical protein JSE7799_00646 [Jannaschia seosinensis]|uniref:Uncharacterized protein n=1 Tax=Jannaschia seosinensis TaxID=313367 RepID=A0A0M7B9E1_9RHOB|nr:hypothetical protein [Jannaschia seosinensis]CUH23829.1 hypothetical protein JSE7799_00646 [Jannaschia seosinensis]